MTFDKEFCHVSFSHVVLVSGTTITCVLWISIPLHLQLCSICEHTMDMQACMGSSTGAIYSHDSLC